MLRLTLAVATLVALWGTVLSKAVWTTAVGPLTNAEVQLYQGEMAGDPVAVTTTDAQGAYRFEIDPVNQGTIWTLSVPHAQVGPAPTPRRPVYMTGALGDRAHIEFAEVRKHVEGPPPHHVTVRVRVIEDDRRDWAPAKNLPDYGPLVISVQTEQTLVPTAGSPTPTATPTATPIPAHALHDSFEGAWYYWDGKSEVYVPDSWQPYWRPRTIWDGQGYYFRPEYKRTTRPERVWDGGVAAQWFNTYANHIAGLWRRVYVGEGQAVRASAWAMAWSSAFDDPEVSWGGSYRLAIGVDPTGGTDPWAATIEWSEPGLPGRRVHDAWAYLSVVTQAQGEYVTVYLRGDAEWPVKHNDAYFDDVWVTYLDDVPPTRVPTATLQPTRTFTPTEVPSATRTETATATRTTPATATPTAEPSVTPTPTSTLSHWLSMGDWHCSGQYRDGILDRWVCSRYEEGL